MSRIEAENIDVKNLHKNVRYQLVGGGGLNGRVRYDCKFFLRALSLKYQDS